ncbi:MAG: serine/threonine-protein phosphatase [Myxococcales bacterium]|nr:serine/threonine-protein phosphatase [Myxococcales bacterium]
MKRAFGYRSEQRKRSENQDSYGVFPFDGYTLAIVCDGMGGHVGGAQASTLAVRTVHEAMKEVRGDHGNALRAALERANQAIYEAARKNHRLMGMGTTAVAAVITDDGTAHVAHVGDSRAYLINEGQAVQVTRDHTMVNLFVDAELLSPEDAATHPEAHVLSRSLGVERQVEVELAEPIELADNDVILLCSDGVHGVVTDWELGSIDWSNPEPGINHVLDIVEAREGDDNATAVAVIVGDADSMPASPLPEQKAIEDSLSATNFLGGGTIIPEEEDDYEPLSDPASYGTEPSAPGRDQAPRSTQDISPRNRGEDGSAKGATPKPNSRKRSSQEDEGGSRIRKPALDLAAVGVLALGGLGAAFFVTRPSGDVDDPIGGGDLTQLAIDGTQPAPQAEPGPAPGPGPDPTPQPVTPPVGDGEHVLVLDVPKAPRRLPHRPARYLQSPPGGQHMFRAVQAARDQKCAESLSAVQDAMGVSPDHAKLYSQAWYCFGNTHGAALDGLTLDDWSRLPELENHLRGWPLPGDPPIAWTKEGEKVPLWYREAADGVEYRLSAWASSDDKDLMREVITDLKGAPTVADELAHDVWIEATMAAALARTEEPDPSVVEAWARRVYIASSAMNGRVGRMLSQHRPELVPTIEQLLAQATTPPEGGKLPPEVERALEVGTGKADAPTVQVAPRVRPSNALPEEPDLGGGSDFRGGGGTIHR